MRTLRNDPRGTAVWIDREARGMDPLQLYREFVQNGIEAEASRIDIDGWRDPETGFLLARITDNGVGLTPDQLVKRLTTLHGMFKASGNYGVGARLAALPFNNAGVTFASRTTKTEGMITLHKYRGEYVTKTWQVEDDDGDIVSEEVVSPDDDMLSRLGTGTGTAVILHGDGQSDTWGPQAGYRVRKFLSRRYYSFGTVDNPNVDVHVQWTSDGSIHPIMPVENYLDTYGLDCGEVAFDKVAGLKGTMAWWIIPPYSEMEKIKGRSRGDIIPAGVGLVVEDEIFNYSRTYMGEFGVIYPSVQGRIAILMFIDKAEMGTSRAEVVLPGENRRNIPWKKLGAYFATHMPEEIEKLLSSVSVAGHSFDAEMAKLLDKDWMKNLTPIKVSVPAKEGENGIGDSNGEGTPPGRDVPDPKKDKGASVGSRNAAERKNSGDSPSKEKTQITTPKVEFLEDFDWETHDFGIVWFSNRNTVLIANNFKPFEREVGRWCERVALPKQVIQAAVRGAYQIEYAATIIDINQQGKFGLGAEQIEDLLSPASLYNKVLGMQALTERIEKFIGTYIKEASSDE